jgi:hypothetical protein
MRETAYSLLRQHKDNVLPAANLSELPHIHLTLAQSHSHHNYTLEPSPKSIRALLPLTHYPQNLSFYTFNTQFVTHLCQRLIALARYRVA